MAFGLVGALILFAISTGVNLLLKPRIKRPRAPGLETPKAEEGVPIPLGYGRFVVAPNIVFVDQPEQIHFKNGATGYACNMVMTLCMGPVDELLDIRVGEKSLRFEPVTAQQGSVAGAEQVVTPPFPYIRTGSADVPTEFIIRAAAMFGGQDQEGGIRGTIRFYWGGLSQPADQVTTAYMQAAGLSGGTGRPGICYVVFGPSANGDAFYWGTVPQIKDIAFMLRFSPNALGVGMLQDANPAEVSYDIMHSNLRGLGLATSLTDTANFTEAAETYSDEGCGIAPLFATQDEVEDMLEDIHKHSSSIQRISPLTGQYQLKLARNDYSVSELPRVTTSLRGASFGNARNLTLSRPNYRETTNDIQITYRRFFTSDVGTVVGRVLTANLDYPDDLLIHFDTHSQNITEVALYDDGVEVPNTAYTFYPDTGIVILFNNHPGSPAEGSVITISYVAGPVYNGYKEATARWQDLAAIQQSGELRSFTADYPFFTSDLIAGLHVARLGQQMGRSLWVAKWEMDRSGYRLASGDVVRINHQPMDQDGNEFEILNDVPFRVTEIDYGMLEDGTITVTAVEDVFAQDALPMLPQPSGGGEITHPAPDMAIGYSATSAIRVCLFPSDPNFQIKLWRASSNLGDGVTTGADVITTVPGTTGYYDDTFPLAGRTVVHSGRPFKSPSRISPTFYGGTQRYGVNRIAGLSVGGSRAFAPPGDTIVVGNNYWYAAQMVPGTSQRGYSDGPLTPWQQMTATAGTPGVCTCTIPSVSYTTSDDGTQGTLTLSVNDSQHRVTLVEFQTQAGLGPLGEWTEGDQVSAFRNSTTVGRMIPEVRRRSLFVNGSLPRQSVPRWSPRSGTVSQMIEVAGESSAPYVATVDTTSSSPSTINYRVTYLNCAGEEVTNLTGSVSFP